jgi:phosphatidate cytidylyltransferase
MTDTSPQSPQSDLPLRFAMGIAMAAAAILLIYFGGISPIGAWVFRLAIVAGAAVMLLEWCAIHRMAPATGYIGATLLALYLLIAGEILYPAGEMEIAITAETFSPVWTGLGAALVTALVAGLMTRRAAMAWGILYIGIPAFALLVIEWTWFGLTFWAMLVTWATDICAYFAGRSIGGAKLAPRLSPKKTWSGLAGGMLGAGIVGWITAYYFDLGNPFLYIGAPMGLIAQGGDLYESWVKRRAGVKDSGTILPGHGGALDRLDGLLPVVVVTLALLMAGSWTG